MSQQREMRSDEDRDPSHPPAEPPPDGDAAPPPVRLPTPAGEDEEEMGGEAPCQLHRFWDVPE